MGLKYQDLQVNGMDFAYATKDTTEEVEVANYFDGVSDRLYRLDYIRVTADINSQKPAVCWFRIDGIEGREVRAVKVGDWNRPGEVKPREPGDVDARVAAVVIAIDKFLRKHDDRGNLDFYTKDGRPKAPLLITFTGFAVKTEDCEAAWAIVTEREKEAA